jgi:riboflavin kinase/FMN adenylyltransferase
MGEEHTFGQGGEGTRHSLHAVAGGNDITATTVKLLTDGKGVVSSTGLRALLLRGEVARAVDMLGHPYLIVASRVAGRGVGRQLGYPTLNFARPASRKVLPPPGVYAAHLQHGRRMLPAALYFGTCPTFESREAHFEVHLLSGGDEVPQQVDTGYLWLSRFVRPDVAFSGGEELTEHIRKDIASIKENIGEEKQDAPNEGA